MKTIYLFLLILPGIVHANTNLVELLNTTPIERHPQLLSSPSNNRFEVPREDLIFLKDVLFQIGEEQFYDEMMYQLRFEDVNELSRVIKYCKKKKRTASYFRGVVRRQYYTYISDPFIKEDLDEMKKKYSNKEIMGYTKVDKKSHIELISIPYPTICLNPEASYAEIVAGLSHEVVHFLETQKYYSDIYTVEQTLQTKNVADYIDKKMTAPAGEVSAFTKGHQVSFKLSKITYKVYEGYQFNFFDGDKLVDPDGFVKDLLDGKYTYLDDLKKTYQSQLKSSIVFLADYIASLSQLKKYYLDMLNKPIKKKYKKKSLWSEVFELKDKLEGRRTDTNTEPSHNTEVYKYIANIEEEIAIAKSDIKRLEQNLK